MLGNRDEEHTAPASQEAFSGKQETHVNTAGEGTLGSNSRHVNMALCDILDGGG